MQGNKFELKTIFIFNKNWFDSGTQTLYSTIENKIQIYNKYNKDIMQYSPEIGVNLLIANLTLMALEFSVLQLGLVKQFKCSLTIIAYKYIFILIRLLLIIITINYRMVSLIK